MRHHRATLHITSIGLRRFITLLVALLLSTLSTPSFRVHSQVNSSQQQNSAGQAEARPRRAAAPATTPQQQQPPAARPTATPATATSASAPRPQTPVGQEIDDDEVVRVDQSLVNLNVRVVDRLNRPINDVRQEEFRVFEDGVPQTISFFTKEEVPISYGLVVDNSGSLRSQIEKVVDAGKTIISSNKPGDETFVVRFVDSDNIQLMQDFTPNQTAILDALDNMFIEGGRTAVIDAVYVSAERAAQHKKDANDRRRRALILITDGEDRDSQYKIEQLLARLREDDVQIFVIGFVNELDKEGGFIRKSPRQKATDLLERLAKETGGRVFFPNSISELPKIAEEITRDLRTQYVIGYYPTNKARDGSYRTVRVALADASNQPKRIAVTRPGYTAPRDGGATPSQPTTRSAQPTTRGRSTP